MEKLQHLFTLQKDSFLSTDAPNRSISYRIKKLKALKNWIINHREDICRAINDDLQRHYSETEVLEIKPTLGEINYTIKRIRDWTDAKPIGRTLALLTTSSKIIPKPKGIVLIISPWNFPFLLAIQPLVSAIASGNHIIIKPSEFSHHTSALINKMIGELFDECEVSVVEGGVDTSKALLQLPFNHIFFTGSSKIGQQVMRNAAEHLSSITLELGGQNAVVVDETASIKDAAKRIIWGKLINAGQSCVAPNHIFVHKKNFSSFCEALKESIAFYYSDCVGCSPFYGRIINERHYNRITQLKETYYTSNKTIIYNGEFFQDDLLIEPFIYESTMDDPILKEEIFGPLLPIIPYKDFNEVIQHISKQPISLTAYLFSKSKRHQKNFERYINAGGIAINETTIHFAHPGLPFGGLNQSGMGKTHGYYGFLEFSNLQSVLKQRFNWSTIDLIRPPYHFKKQRFIRFAARWF